jgi:hypothetical protein
MSENKLNSIGKGDVTSTVFTPLPCVAAASVPSLSFQSNITVTALPIELKAS